MSLQSNSARAALFAVSVAALGCGGGVPLDQYPAEQAEAYCAAYANCFPTVLATQFGATPDACFASFAGDAESALPSYQELVERGTLRYDASAAQRCLDEIAAAGCDVFIAANPESCRETFVGMVEIGGACSTSQECAGDAYCADEACPADAGTCTARQSSGTECTFGDQCATGLVCEQGLCRLPMAMSGGDCTEDGGLDCPLGEVCLGADDAMDVLGVCTPWTSLMTRVQGEACDLNQNEFCDPLLSCVVTAIATDGSPTFQCRTRVGAGDACQIGFPNQCPDDYYCNAPFMPGMADGTCEPLPAAGEPCLDPPVGLIRFCALGLFCTSAGTCAAGVANGDPCTSSEVCYSGNCVSGTCEAPLVCP
jgi:hypothetical protein